MNGGKAIINQVQLAEMWGQGRPIPEIAQHFGVRHTAITNMVRTLDLTPRTAKEIDDDEFRRLWIEGLTHGSLAGHFGIAIGSVNNHQRRLGLLPRRHYEKPAKPSPTAVAPVATVIKTTDMIRAENRIGRMEPHPFWNAERDLLVLTTKGQNLAMGELATALGRKFADVQKRWHLLRSAR